MVGTEIHVSALFQSGDSIHDNLREAVDSFIPVLNQRLHNLSRDQKLEKSRLQTEINHLRQFRKELGLGNAVGIILPRDLPKGV